VRPGNFTNACTGPIRYIGHAQIQRNIANLKAAASQVKVEDAFLPWTYERIVPPSTLAQYWKWAELRIDALNHALQGLPQERIHYHICWGSWNAPHIFDIFDVPLKDIIDLLLKLIPGVISRVTNVVEHPELGPPTI
jgi:5-methyltetrahydropteroyltriglutamate--homocysteine methyltransferase